MESLITPIGAALLVLGIVAFMWRKKRIFERTNSAGVQQFNSFWSKGVAVSLDGFLKLLALFFLTTGVIVLAFQYQDTWGWMVLLPVYAAVLFMLLGT